MNRLGWLGLSIVSIALLGVWGLFSKLALRDLEWPQVIFFYYGVAVLVMLVTYRRLGGGEPIGRRTLGLLVVAGLCGTGGTTCFYLALEGQKASLVVPLIAGVYPVLTALLSRAFLKERLSPTTIAGVAFAIAAVVLISVG